MANPVPGLASQTPILPNTPIDALAAGLTGGYIYNPSDAPTTLYVNPTGPASTAVDGTSIGLLPGHTFYAIPGSTLTVSVVSTVSSHRFISVQWV